MDISLIPKRILDRIEFTDTCWIWHGNKGKYVTDPAKKLECICVHYLFWEMEHGPIISDDLYLVRQCDNNRCVNPSHYTSETLNNRIWSLTDRSNPDGCWPWRGSLDGDGYAKVHVSKNKSIKIARYLFEMFYGKQDPSLITCHKCDNPLCVNPHHIFMGTVKDNNLDMFRKGRNGSSAKVLSRDKANQIRELRANGTSRRELATIFQVTDSTINNILSNKAYKT